MSNSQVPAPPAPAQLIELESNPGYDALCELVETDMLQVVPDFHRYKDRQCVVICDEEGALKRKPWNTEATDGWRAYLNATGVPYSSARAILVGHVVVLYTDKGARF